MVSAYLLGPAVLIVATIPMILGIVPRNPLYGFRTQYTMSSDEVWYPANRIAGVAILVSGLVWAGLAIVLPIIQPAIPSRQIQWLGRHVVAVRPRGFFCARQSHEGKLTRPQARGANARFGRYRNRGE